MLTRIHLNTLMICLILFPAGVPLLGQNAWDQGTAGMDYGFPWPNTHWEVEGNILDLDLPSQGAGAFRASLADTNIFLAAAYDIYNSEEDTLADILLVLIQDSVEVGAGSYAISPLEGTGAFMAWLPGVSAELITSLIDTAFSLDSLTSLNAYLAVTGEIEIEVLAEDQLEISFLAALAGTDLSVITVNNGFFSCSSSLPTIEYTLGHYTQSDDLLFWDVEGELNPLEGEDGVGAFSYVDADTITYVLISYWPESESGVTAHGLVIRDLLTDLWENEYIITPPIPAVPSAFAFETYPLQMLDLAALLSGDLDPENLGLELLSVSGGPVIATQTETEFSCGYSAEYSDPWGVTIQLGDEWTLANDWSALSVDPVALQAPETPWLGASYPNPFNNHFTLPVQLDRTDQVHVSLVDLLGREQLVLFEAQLPPGYHLLNLSLFDPELASGWYGCRVSRGDGRTAVRSVLYLK